MRLRLTIIILLSAFFAQAQNNPNPAAYKFVSMYEAMHRHMEENAKVEVTEDGIGGSFVAKLRSRGYTPDSALVWACSDSINVLVRDVSQASMVNVLWFGLKNDGVTDNYNQMQRLAAWASKINGLTLYYPKGVYKIDTMKTGTPKMKTNIVERDSIYVDSSGATNDTIIYTIIDTVTTVSQTYIANNITDIIWRDPQNLHIIGDGAIIDIKGDFDRKWTHSTASGFTHMSAYNTVCPFLIAWGKNVTIEGITINGNDDKTTETTPVNEGQAYGLWFQGTDGITVRNCTMHHIQTDGMYIEGSGGGADGPNGGKHYHASRNANVENVTTLYCGRQGLTIGGLNVGKFTNCHFDATGDTTGFGTQQYAFRGHAPQKGLDIEPIYEYSHNTLIRTDRMTSNITFENCTFLDNMGGSIALSHPYTVQDVTFKNCTLDNSKYNRVYNVISTIPGLTFEDCDINTGTGAMYLTRDAGGLQRITLKGNTIRSGGSGFISGSAAQFGALVEANWIIGTHDTSYKGPFPYISSNAIFKNNYIVLDSALYLGTGKKLQGQIYSQTAEGNTYISQMDTLAGRTNYTILYTYPRMVRGESYDLKQAVRPYGGWDGSYFTAAETGIGAVQVAYGAAGKPIKTYWLTALPTKGIYNKGDIVVMIDPGAAGWDRYRCTVGGDAALGQVTWVPVGAISLTGLPVYHNAQIISGSDFYVGRAFDSGATSKLATALLPNGGAYFTKAVSDTGIIAFKSPFTFGAVLADMIIEGSVFIRGKGNTDFTVSAKTNGNFTFTTPSLKINGDSNFVAMKVRWLKDASNAYYLGFNDTNTVNVDKTIISLNRITITSATTANMVNATTAWTPMLIKSLSGFTATNMTNTSSVSYKLVTDKPTSDGILEGTTNKYYTDPRARAAISLNFTTTGTSGPATGTYNAATGQISINTPQYTGSGGGNNYHLPYDGISTHYLGGDTLYHAFPTTDGILEGATNKYYTDTRSRAAVSLNFTTSGTSGAATGTYNATTGQISINIPQYTGGGGGAESDPLYSANGVTLNSTQTLTAFKIMPASTASNPSIVLANSATNYIGTSAGAMWTYNQHLYVSLNGVTTQLDHQAFDTSQCCTFITNGTGLQAGANMNITGSAGVGSLFFNSTPATGTAGDNILTISSSGQVTQLPASSAAFPSNTINVTTDTYTVPNVSGSRVVVIVNYSVGTATITLPSASLNNEKDVVIKNITSKNVVVPNGFISDPNTMGAFTYGSFWWHSNGTTWYMIGKL